MRIVDLFCGAGGASEGAKVAGHTVVGAADWDEQALATYRLNHPGHAVRMDLRDVDAAAAWLEALAPDCVLASCPCQDFSQANRDLALLEGERASLTLRTCELLARTRPPWFLLENVPRMLKSPMWAQGRALLEAAGYAVEARVVDANTCGVCQRRLRVFVCGCRLPGRAGLVREWGAAVGAMKACRKLAVTDVFPGVGYYYFYQRASRPPCIRRGSQPYLCVRRNSHYRPRSYAARAGDACAWGAEVRVFTVGELALIQGFPDTYKWPAGITARARMLQIANAVPPPMARAVLACVPHAAP